MSHSTAIIFGMVLGVERFNEEGLQLLYVVFNGNRFKGLFLDEIWIYV